MHRGTRLAKLEASIAHRHGHLHSPPLVRSSGSNPSRICSTSSKIRTDSQLTHLIPNRRQCTGSHPSGSQTFRLPQVDSILRKVPTRPNHLHLGMSKLRHMATTQMLLPHKHTATEVRLLGNITVEVLTSRYGFALGVHKNAHICP